MIGRLACVAPKIYVCVKCRLRPHACDQANPGGARFSPRNAFQLRRSARLQAPDYRPLYRVKFHHSSTADDPAAARRKQQRRSRRRRRERQQRRRLRTEHLPFWRLLAVAANNNNNAGEPAEDDADWTAFGADQMATARDLLQAEGHTLNDWVQFDEASADWVPLTLAELKQLSDGVHRGSDSTAAGDRTCPVCLGVDRSRVTLK
ncbi:hypothetical protein niasHT_031833 [Heterodera trifolii]|uniref:Uncharacterized protein n=1 Tax=Heterodera trifolii TaxID=157864 RepID=A0ABD2HUV5_9BILA